MGVFQNLKRMRANPDIALDYESVVCPNAERACAQTVWLTHTLLLAERDAVGRIADAIEKVAAHAAEIPA
jgi:hypothetical protein